MLPTLRRAEGPRGFHEETVMTTSENLTSALALRVLLAAIALGACWFASHATIPWFGAIGAELARRTGGN